MININKVNNIAQHIINYCNTFDIWICNSQLQRLLYFLWLDYYKKVNKYLFNEPFQAWPLGPINTTAYYEYYMYGAEEITRITKINLDLEDTYLNTINEILYYYKDFSLFNLSELSKIKGGSWDIVYDNGNGKLKEIPFSLMIKNII